MKFHELKRFVAISHIALYLLLFICHTSAFSADRLAIGPFFAPPGQLQGYAAALPDLLLTEMSGGSRFQLVERDQLNSVLKEQKVTAAGLTSTETILQLGRLLSAEWLVSGSIAPTGTETQVWVKIINMQSGIVADMNAFPYNKTNSLAAVKFMAAFISEAGQKKKPRQFITMGLFQDFTASPDRQDLSRRLPAIIERHFHKIGFGVLEREAVAPLLEEYGLASGGFTSSSNKNQVKIQPAFWIVDGGAQWTVDAAEKINVALRVQKVGYQDKVLRFDVRNESDFESSVVQALEKALTETNQVSLSGDPIAEAKVHAVRARALARGDVAISSRGSKGDPYEDEAEMHREIRRELEAAVLLNPQDRFAKFHLGMELLRPGLDKSRGIDLLKEVTAAGPPDLVAAAGIALEEQRVSSGFVRRTFVILHEFEAAVLLEATDFEAKLDCARTLLVLETKNWRGLDLMKEIVANAPPGVVADARITEHLAPEILRSKAAEVRPANAEKTKASFASVWIEDPTYFPPVAFAGLNGIWIPISTNLYFFDIVTKRGNRFPLPIRIQNAIAAKPKSQVGRSSVVLVEDKENLWVGTGGDGLFQLNKNGDIIRHWSTSDGFPRLLVSAMVAAEDRLWIGFGNSIGYIDFQKNAFIGLPVEVPLFNDGSDGKKSAPMSYVRALGLGYGKLIASDGYLEEFDLRSQSWQRPITHYIGSIIAHDDWLAVDCSFPNRQVKIRRPKTIEFENLPVFEGNSVGDYAFAMRDEKDGKYLWVGSEKELAVVKLNDLSLKMVYDLGDARYVSSIHDFADKGIFFITGSKHSDGRNKIYIRWLSGRSSERQAFWDHSQPEGTIDPTTQFLQRNFSKFVPVQFQRGANGEALFQRLPVKENLMAIDGKFYVGFRFVFPAWADGNFRWLHVLAKTEQQKDFSSANFAWGIIAETGKIAGFRTFQKDVVVRYPDLKRQFPHTKSFFRQEMELDRLEPGKTYGILFSFEEKDMVDIAFAMTIDSERGAREFGALPLH